jgi:sugar/nucleoside kinase (ribokinase family)
VTGQGIFVGLCTLDLVYLVSAYPRPNSKSTAKQQAAFAGGPAANAAVTFGHLAGHAHLVSVVGTHPLATVITDDLRRHHVTLHDLAPQPDLLPTISSIIVTEDDGSRTVVSVDATRAQPRGNILPEVPLGDTSVLLIDGHYLGACHAAAGQAKKRDIPVVLDGGRWKRGIEDLLPSIDIVICSADFRPPGLDEKSSVLDFILSRGVGAAAVTRGADPIQYRTDDNAGELPVEQVRVVDTLGAGDVLHGAFCYFYAIESHSFVDSLVRAAAVATKSCQSFGTRQWMHSSSGSDDRSSW